MKKALYLLLVLAAQIATAQNEDIDLEEFAERLFQLQDETIIYEDIYESLLVYYSNKLNLNNATYEQLASLFILNPNQLESFFRYRSEYGALLSLNELQVIEGFDVTTIRTIKPFVSVNETILDGRPFLVRVMKEENNYLLLRHSRILQLQKGYTPALPLDTTIIRNDNNEPVDTVTTAPQRFRGSPDKLYGRFRTSRRGDFSLGFTFEKDAGERFEFTNKTRGFDFYSYHLLLENKLGFDRIMLGDFQLQIGQGAVFGAGFVTGKGAETVNTTKRNTIGLLPYTSVLESGFFRGVGLTKKIGPFKVTGFYSRLAQDANIQQDTTVSAFEEFVNSIQNTGLHRTERELSFKNEVDESSFGGVLEYRPNRRFSAGISGLSTHFSTPLQRRPTNVNQFEFSGDQNQLLGTFFHYTWQNFTFFGEGAQSRSGGVGAIGGFVASLSPMLDLSIVLRNYDKDFHSFYGNAMAEGSRNINERGTYWGLSIRPNRKNRINFYYDSFSFPWLRFGTEAPSSGYEWLARYTYTPRKQVILYAQARQQLRQVTLPEGNLNVLRDQVKRNYIFNIDYAPNPWLRLKTKVQSSTQNEGDRFSKGFAIAQDVNFAVWKVNVYTRLALFDTQDFDNAQYFYEKDVLYAFSLPAYNGKGIRTYAMIRYDPTRKLSLWFRYAQFSFRQMGVIGSGLAQIEGNILSEIKLMARVKF